MKPVFTETGPQKTPGQRVKVITVTPLDAYKVRITAVPDDPEYYRTQRYRKLFVPDHENLDWPHLDKYLEDLPSDSEAIATASQLAGLQGDRKYHLIADIDLSEYSWTPLTTSDVLLDGRHHKIIGLDQSLFGRVQGLTVRNLQFARSSISTRGGVLAHQVTGGVCRIEQVSSCPQCLIIDDSVVEGSYRVCFFVSEILPNVTNSTLTNILGRGTVRTTSQHLEGGGLAGITFVSTTFDRCQTFHDMVYTQTNASEVDTRGAICYSDEIFGSNYMSCHVGCQVIQPEDSVSITVGMAFVYSNIRADAPPIFTDCTYASTVVNPDLSQGNIATD